MKIKILITLLCLMAGAMLFMAFGGGENVHEGQNLQSVKIGKQVWMVKNLNVDSFRNGDPIVEARTRTEWQKAGQEHRPVWCYYGNDPANGSKYGRLYNWYAVIDPRGLAPSGWHVPTDDEWTELTEHFGGEEVAGARMKSTGEWKENMNDVNTSQFSALPGGACADDGYLGSIGYLGVWWSATEDTSYYYGPGAYAWYRYLYFSKSEVIRYSHSKGNGFSVRCLRD